MNNSSQKAILIADDDPVSRTILRSVISKAGYTVLTAESGADALRIATAESPDVIILDIVMPDIDGTEVAQILRKNPRTRKIPIIFLSGLISIDEERSNVRRESVSYLAKPLTHDKLLNEVRKFLIMKDDT